MGWLNKTFKGSSHKVSEGQYNGRYGSGILGNYPSSSMDAFSEMEDVDRAIALSPSEADQKAENVIDFESQLKEDEQLARALQESLNCESPPQHENIGGHANGSGNFYQPIPSSCSVGFRICAGCNTELGMGDF